MSTINLHQTTTLTPEQCIAGLTDFGPGRSKLFGNSADEYLKVHQLGHTEADVTEGSGGIWERLHYDWSNPNHVILTTTDSNLWGGASGHTYRISRDVCLASCSGLSARAFWKRRLNKALRLSKPGTHQMESGSLLEHDNAIQRARQLDGGRNTGAFFDFPALSGTARRSWRETRNCSFF